MLMLYNIGIRFYYMGVLFAAIFSRKARLWLAGRKDLLARIEAESSSFRGETLWVHCASLGEFEMARPVMERLKSQQPKMRLVLTFFSPSGYEIRKNFALAEHVYYLPLDSSNNAQRFVQAIRPNKVVFVKYDLWYHHLKSAKNFGAKLILISAQFRSDQVFFRFYGGIGRDILRWFDRIFLVDAHSKKLLDGIDISSTEVCGDTRFDRVMAIAASFNPIAAIESFKGSAQLIVCGSTWVEDEELLAICINSFPEVKWVIAPHEVEEENLTRIEELFPNSIRLSTFKNEGGSVLIVDSIGQLSSMYRYAYVAYLGGAFRTGLHNILEATAYGVPAVFGPDHSRFPAAGEMVERGIAFSVHDHQELAERFKQLLSEDRSRLRADILDFMTSRLGATQAIVEYTNKC